MIRAKDNPFAVHQWERVGYIPQSENLAQLVERLARLGYTAAIVGPHGAGKSTLLSHLEKCLSRRGVATAKLFRNLDTRLPWRRVKEAIGAMPSEGVLFFDGANHLPFLRFQQLKRMTRKRSIGLVTTSHTEGLLPTLTICKPRPALLSQIVQMLTANHTTYAENHLDDVFRRHNGNIRDCLRQLYDEYAMKESYPSA